MSNNLFWGVRDIIQCLFQKIKSLRHTKLDYDRFLRKN